MKKLTIILIGVSIFLALGTSKINKVHKAAEEIINQKKPSSISGLGNMFIPGDLPWPGSMIGGQQVIMQPGVAFLSCGTLLAVSSPERFTLGLFNIENAVPPSGRSNVTASTPVWHHPSWHIDSIGNIFGVAVNTRTGDLFAAASSNYGSGYLGKPAVVRYGEIGGGPNSPQAAGTVYRLDAVSGQASVFVQLPQQPFTFNQVDCETGSIVNRPNAGVALGNITYDEYHDQFFVTNIEDGRIYRVSNTGVILDSYDPLSYDNGAAGISDLDSLAYGVTIEPGGTRLFFGTPDDVADGANYAAPEHLEFILSTLRPTVRLWDPLIIHIYRRVCRIIMWA